MGRHIRVGTPLEQALDSARHRLEPAGQPKDNKELGSPAQPSPHPSEMPAGGQRPNPLLLCLALKVQGVGGWGNW